MRSQKHGLKALVLGIVVVLGALAFASGAQAQTHTELLSAHAEHNKAGGVLNPSPLTEPSKTSTPGEFLINLGPALLATITAAQEGTSVLLVAGRVIEIRCTGLTLNSGKIDSSSDALVEATFTGCKTYDHKTLTELTTCLFKELETIKAKFLILPIVHGGEAFLLFEPQEGTSFTVISYKPGIGCTLPLNNPITGSFAALVEALDAVTQSILLNQGIQLLTGDVLPFGGFSSYITANVQVALSGEHAGLKLGIHQVHSEKSLEEEELAELKELEELKELHKEELEELHELELHKEELEELAELEELHELELHKEELEELAELHELKLHEEELHNLTLGLPASSKLGTYLINLGNALLATVSAKQIGESYILVAGRDLEINCTSFDLNEGKISTSTDAIGKITFLGCQSSSHSTGALLPCELKTPGTIAAETLILPTLHGGDQFLLFEPIEGAANLTIVSYKAGTGCTLPLNNPVAGSITAKVDTADAVTQLLLFNENLQLLTGDKLTFGASAAYVGAHVEVELSGAHAGQKLGIH